MRNNFPQFPGHSADGFRQLGGVDQGVRDESADGGEEFRGQPGTQPAEEGETLAPVLKDEKDCLGQDKNSGETPKHPLLEALLVFPPFGS